MVSELEKAVAEAQAELPAMFVVCVVIEPDAIADIRAGWGDTIEGVCAQLNDLMPNDIRVRPLSEVIAC